MIIVGYLAFLLFWLNDYNDLRLHCKALGVCFPAGAALLTYAVVNDVDFSLVLSSSRGIQSLIFAAIFAVFLLYALIFSLPVKVAYFAAGEERPVSRRGLYGLCRHPGILILWTIMFLLWFGCGLSASAALLYSALNLALAIYEDKYVFPETLTDYRQYKAQVPFLIPDFHRKEDDPVDYRIHEAAGDAMNFQDKLRVNGRKKVWAEYCGFLDLSLDEYMFIQKRLMSEQIACWCRSGLGKSLLHGQTPGSIEKFRDLFPLTSYRDYADILLAKDAEKLPAKPIVWIQTTWEGGIRPIKVAPYTREMLNTYRRNIVAVALLASCRKLGEFTVESGDSCLYGGAPLPYITGLLPSVLDEEIRMKWLPDTNENSGLSFGSRIKKGFSMGMRYGVDYFFAIGSVAEYITENFSKMGSSKKGSSKIKLSAKITFRYLRAKYICGRENREMRPGDIFKLKGFVATGTDARYYKQRLADAWGVMPIEIAAGTESTCLASETCEQKGMVFFPDACFYEFIPEDEMLQSLADPDFVPRTCLMNEVRAGVSYELVISVLHGGAFMRYRIGDVYHCLSAEEGKLPHFTYVDRIPTVIDIAGFTRITESSIGEVIRMSGLTGIADWFARKEYDENTPFMHMFLEMKPEAGIKDANILAEHLTVYFKHFDSDYSDLKKMLNIEPLQITVLPIGTMNAFRAEAGRMLCRINPNPMDVAQVIKIASKLQTECREKEGKAG